MASLADTALSPAERRVLDRFATALRDELGQRLAAVWLYGSRARAEARRRHSDVDLIVLSDAGRDDRPAVARIAAEAMLTEREETVLLSTHTERPGWLAERRAVDDFFVAEVDRDRVIVFERRL